MDDQEIQYFSELLPLVGEDSFSFLHCSGLIEEFRRNIQFFEGLTQKGEVRASFERQFGVVFHFLNTLGTEVQISYEMVRAELDSMYSYLRNEL